jgi:Dolichyl-phosphate-mannose-protein mannosyltransferase
LRLRLTTGLLIFILTLTVYVFGLNGVWAIDHASSFLELDYSIWVNHSFILGSAPHYKPQSVDDFEYDGHFFSALAPGTAILALPLVGLGFILDGHFTLFGHAMLLSEFFVAITNAAAASVVYLISRFLFSKKISAFLGFAYAFSTISWPFATYFFQSDVSSLFCVVAVYFTFKATREMNGRLTNSLFAGLAVAVGMLVDYIDAVFIPIILLYIILVFKKNRGFLKPAVAFLCTALLGLVWIGLYNYFAFGSPFTGSEQLYLHASSVFAEFSYPLWEGVYLNLFTPYRGLFVYCLLLVLGLFGFYDMLRDSPYRKEALLLLACFLGIFIPYSMWYDPTGGEGFGPRFLVGAIPFLLVPAGMVLQNADKKMWALSLVLYAEGVVTNGIAGLTQAVTPSYSDSTWPFLTWTLPRFLDGETDVWWLKYDGGHWVIPCAIIIAAALVAPLLSGYILDRRSSDESAEGTPKATSAQ